MARRWRSANEAVQIEPYRANLTKIKKKNKSEKWNEYLEEIKDDEDHTKVWTYKDEETNMNL